MSRWLSLVPLLLLLALAAYIAYCINAAQFVAKLRAARRQAATTSTLTAAAATS